MLYVPSNGRWHSRPSRFLQVSFGSRTRYIHKEVVSITPTNEFGVRRFCVCRMKDALNRSNLRDARVNTKISIVLICHFVLRL